MVTIKVVDLRHERGADAFRVNVSRMPHASSDYADSRLGNPYRPKVAGDTLERYTAHLATLGEVMDELQFEVEVSMCDEVELACWCGGASTCHANVIAAELRRRLAT